MRRPFTQKEIGQHIVLFGTHPPDRRVEIFVPGNLGEPTSDDGHLPAQGDIPDVMCEGMLVSRPYSEDAYFVGVVVGQEADGWMRARGTIIVPSLMQTQTKGKESGV